MIPIHLCSTGQSFKHTYEKDIKKPAKKDYNRIFGGHKLYTLCNRP